VYNNALIAMAVEHMRSSPWFRGCPDGRILYIPEPSK